MAENNSKREEFSNIQLNDTERMANELCEKFETRFKEKIDNCEIFDVVDEPSHRAFKIRFEAYNYFIILFNYDLDRMGCSIEYGKYYISLENSQRWYSGAHFNAFFDEFQKEVELRIPDKFLEDRGWK